MCSFNVGVYVFNADLWREQNITKQLEYWTELNTRWDGQKHPLLEEKNKQYSFCIPRYDFCSCFDSIFCQEFSLSDLWEYFKVKLVRRNCPKLSIFLNINCTLYLHFSHVLGHFITERVCTLFCDILFITERICMVLVKLRVAHSLQWWSSSTTNILNWILSGTSDI